MQNFLREKIFSQKFRRVKFFIKLSSLNQATPSVAIAIWCRAVYEHWGIPMEFIFPCQIFAFARSHLNHFDSTRCNSRFSVENTWPHGCSPNVDRESDIFNTISIIFKNVIASNWHECRSLNFSHFYIFIIFIYTPTFSLVFVCIYFISILHLHLCRFIYIQGVR